MKIKVCGMRDSNNIKAVTALGVDMIGYSFYQSSPRYVSMISSRAGIIPDYADTDDIRLRKSGAGDCVVRPFLKVGVFKDDMPQSILTRVVNYSLDCIQLDGEESSVMIDNLRRTLCPDIVDDITIIKTIRISDVADVNLWRRYKNADMFLFKLSRDDSDKSSFLDELNAYDGDAPFLVAGGFCEKDAEWIKTLKHPKFEGVSVSTGFEKELALKDTDALERFVIQLKGNNIFRDE